MLLSKVENIIVDQNQNCLITGRVLSYYRNESLKNDVSL